MRGLVILPRFRNEGPSQSLAYYHPKDSLTWRWCLSVQWRFPDWKHPKNWLRVSRYVYPIGDAGTLHVAIGPWGFQFQWQPTRMKQKEPKAPKMNSPQVFYNWRRNGFPGFDQPETDE